MIVYNIVGSATVIMAVVYLAITTVWMFKKEFNSVANIKGRIVLSSILLALFIVKIITAVILGDAIGSEIVCAVIWAVNTTISFLNLKITKVLEQKVEYAQDVIDVDFTEVQCEDVIDVDLIEVQYENSNE